MLHELIFPRSAGARELKRVRRNREGLIRLRRAPASPSWRRRTGTGSFRGDLRPGVSRPVRGGVRGSWAGPPCAGAGRAAPVRRAGRRFDAEPGAKRRFPGRSPAGGVQTRPRGRSRLLRRESRRAAGIPSAGEASRTSRRRAATAGSRNTVSCRRGCAQKMCKAPPRDGSLRDYGGRSCAPSLRLSSQAPRQAGMPNATASAISMCRRIVPAAPRSRKMNQSVKLMISPPMT